MTRWEQAGVPRGNRYDERFRDLEAKGVDVHGEASCVEALLAAEAREPGTAPSSGARATVLDAGCGTGRVAIELAARGFEVVGVDLDPVMLDEARHKAPALEWVHADLAQLRLRRLFDAAVLAGNVMLFVGPGTEADVLARIAEHVRPGGLVVAGFQLSGRLTLDVYDAAAVGARLDLVARFATWDRQPFAGGDYVVNVHRRRTD
ncbi:MAG TPA: class I SAM-dependent methyltransferase [Acidimicrobiia bacterium]